MYIILGIILVTAVGVLGDFFIKLSGQGDKFIDWKIFLISLLVYASTAFGWFYLMKHIKLSSLGVIYALSTVLLLVGVGVFYFHEKLNITEIIGISFAVISLILLSRFA
jgi:drug/metabolite transporter (DMT)-like permease